MCNSIPKEYSLDDIAELKMLNKSRAQDDPLDETTKLKRLVYRSGNLDDIAKLKMLAQENLPDETANLKVFSSEPQDNLDEIAKLKMWNSTNQDNFLSAAAGETSMITEQPLTKEQQQLLEQTKLMKCEQQDTQQMIAAVAKGPLQDISQIPSDILQRTSLGVMTPYDDVKLQPHIKTTVYNITGVNGDTSENSVWRNIMNQTQNLIDSYDTGSYVSTYAEIHVTRRLHHHGAVFVTGRPGTGKSRIGHHVLKHIAKTSQRKPLILTSAHDWNMIPKSSPSGDEKSRCEEFVVMVDDIFGQSDLNERFLDDWERMFDLMWPSVESGQILLLLTSRTNISGACQARLLRYYLFKNIKTVELGEGQFALKLKEKATFWSKLCGKLGLPEDAIVEICNMKTFLGFPKCCTLFASTKGVRKYGCAYDFLATDVKTLKGNDKVGYFVLLLILVTDGLDKKRLDRPTREFKDEIETLADTCIDFTPNCKMIKDKLEQFCGIYLTRKCYKYTFKNMFAFNAAFLEFAPTHLDMLLPVCPTSTLVRIVRTAPHQLGTSTVSVTEDLYDEFVKHILCTLQQGDLDILDHPCFHEDRFISLLIEQADADSARAIATKDIGAVNVDIPIFSLDPMLPTSTSELLTCLRYMFRNETIIRYSYQLSFMIMKGLVGLVKLLLDQLPDTIPRSILSESLTCAVYANDSTTVTMLIDKGASPTADTLTAVCSVSDRDVIFMDKVVGLIDLGSAQDARKLISLAMQCGNFRMANLIIKELIASGQIFASCLIQLLYQHSGLFKQGSRQQTWTWNS